MTHPGSAGLPDTREGAMLRLDTAHGPLEITVCTPRIVRVRLALGDQASGPSYVKDRPWDRVKHDIGSGKPTVLATGAFRLRLEENPLSLLFEDGSDSLL